MGKRIISMSKHASRLVHISVETWDPQFCLEHKNILYNIMERRCMQIKMGYQILKG